MNISNRILVSLVVNSQENLDLPSIIELLFLKITDDSLKQAVGHIINTILQSLRISGNHIVGTNIAAILTSLIDLLCLRYADGNLIENLFGFHRVDCASGRYDEHADRKLMKWKKYLSWILQVFGPCFSHMVHVTTDVPSTSSSTSYLHELDAYIRARRFLWQWIDVYITVRYFHQTIAYHNTDSYLLRYRLIKRSSSSLSSSSLTSSRLTTVLYLSIILLRVISYYTQSITESDATNNDDDHSITDNNIRNSTIDSSSSSSISYPHKPSVGIGCLIPVRDKCAICREHHVDPCASTGGYVFCYSCLISYTQTHSRCPVTGCYCAPGDIVRVFLKE